MPKVPVKRHGDHLASTGLAAQYCSPHRPRDKKKTRTVVEITENAERQRKQLQKLELLKQGKQVTSNEPTKQLSALKADGRLSEDDCNWDAGLPGFPFHFKDPTLLLNPLAGDELRRKSIR
jgi:hypothetical protein